MAKVSSITKLYKNLVNEGEDLMASGQYREAVNRFNDALIIAQSIDDNSYTDAYCLLFTSVRFLTYKPIPIDLMNYWW